MLNVATNRGFESIPMMGIGHKSIDSRAFLKSSWLARDQQPILDLGSGLKNLGCPTSNSWSRQDLENGVPPLKYVSYHSEQS